MKICSMCDRNLPEDQFATRPSAEDGLQYHCRDCQKQYRRDHYLKNREKYIDSSIRYKNEFLDWWTEYRKQFKCKTCGEDHVACLHFHHTDKNKVKSVSILAHNGSKTKLLNEIKKCEVLCANCHAKLHYDERQAGVV